MHPHCICFCICTSVHCSITSIHIPICNSFFCRGIHTPKMRTICWHHYCHSLPIIICSPYAYIRSNITFRQNTITRFLPSMTLLILWESSSWQLLFWILFPVETSTSCHVCMQILIWITYTRKQYIFYTMVCNFQPQNSPPAVQFLMCVFCFTFFLNFLLKLSTD